MYTYKNGSYLVMILDDGTKIRYNKLNIYKPDRVENIDIKITNQCDMGCVMCHENSTPDGEHADLIATYPLIANIPPYTELAIGGGNPLCHPRFEAFIENCHDLNLICNVTVNKTHFTNPTYFKNLSFWKQHNCLHGIGVSVFDVTDEEIEMLKKMDAVCHVIIGVTPISVLYKLAHSGLKILILGYKEFRRGAYFYEQNAQRIDNLKVVWSKWISTAIKERWYSVLSFDNLAIKQLDLKNKLSQEEWDSFFMGDDGIDGEFSSASMYIDLVKMEFAKNSCAPLTERYSCKDFHDNVNDMFKYLLTK